MDATTAHTAVQLAINKALASRPPSILDVAILGSISGHYGWFQSRLVDADLWVLTSNRQSAEALSWIRGLVCSTRAEVNRRLPALTFRAAAIDGPYKPAPLADGEIFFLHLLVDDHASYRSRSIFTRYSWRKYHAQVAPLRLFELAPPRPEAGELLNCAWGIVESIKSCALGTVVLPELDLFTGETGERIYGAHTFQFREACTYAVMTNARNLARTHGHKEPDKLPNAEFGQWYHDVYSDGFVATIARIKREASDGLEPSITTEVLCSRVLHWCEGMRAVVTEPLSR